MWGARAGEARRETSLALRERRNGSVNPSGVHPNAGLASLPPRAVREPPLDAVGDGTPFAPERHRRGWLVRRSLTPSTWRASRLRSFSRASLFAEPTRSAITWAAGAETLVFSPRCRSGSSSPRCSGSTIGTTDGQTIRPPTRRSASSVWSRSAPGSSSSAVGRRRPRSRSSTG